MFTHVHVLGVKLVVYTTCRVKGKFSSLGSSTTNREAMQCWTCCLQRLFPLNSVKGRNARSMSRLPLCIIRSLSLLHDKAVLKEDIEKI